MSDSRSATQRLSDRAHLAWDAIVPPFSAPRRAYDRLRRRFIVREAKQAEAAFRAMRGGGGAPKVVVVSGCRGDSQRYRAAHLVEIVGHMGGAGVVFNEDHPCLNEPRLLLDGIDWLIFHRCAYGPLVETLTSEAKRRGIGCLYDTDDLIFDMEAAPSDDPGVGSFGKGEDAKAQLSTMKACDHVITSTDYLKARAEALGLRASSLANGFSRAMMMAADQAADRKSSSKLVLGYASGTPTHDRDLALIEDALCKTLNKYEHVVLLLMGHVGVPASLRRFKGRVQRRPFVPWTNLPQRLKDLHINLAPFCDNSNFSKGKSALKYLEAGLVGTPTIASPMPAYAACIETEKNGLLATSPAQWVEHLQTLIENDEVRTRIARCAQETVRSNDTLERRVTPLAAIFDAAQSG